MVQTTLIILTRNEINAVKSMIRKIPFEKFDEFFAVDYNSTDGTVEFFKKHNIPVLRQKNGGRANAFYEGVAHAKGKYVFFFSPDGNEDPRDLSKFIYYLKKGFDLVIASRFMRNARNEEDDKILKFRAWANQIFTFIVNITWHGKLTDSINGYRAMKKDKFLKLHLDAQGYAIEFQMSIRALKLGYKIIEIPTIEGDRIGGKSGSDAIPTGLYFLWYLVREIFVGTNFASRYHASRK